MLDMVSDLKLASNSGGKILRFMVFEKTLISMNPRSKTNENIPNS